MVTGHLVFPLPSELWEKYGLGFEYQEAYYKMLLYNPKMEALFTSEYIALVTKCHNAVASYLENHSDEVQLYLDRKEGYRYFEILKRAAPDWFKEVMEWSERFLTYES